MAVLVVAFMAWQTYVATGAATQSLEQEINRGGISLVTALATALNPRWVQDLGSRGELIRMLHEFSSHPGTRQVLNVVVDDINGPIATALGESSISRSEAREVNDPLATVAGVEIREFTYGGTPVRSFSRFLYSHEDPSKVEAAAGSMPSPSGIGRIEVYVSAKEIDDSRERLSGAMTKVALTACAVAVIAAMVLARFLTAPIRTLLADMKHVSLGDLQHKSKVTSSDELGELARAFNAMTTSLHAAQEAKLSQRAMEYELSVAAQIQERLLPSAIPRVEGYDLAVHYSPAKEVGGDYYDFLEVGGDKLGIVVADVSGKGVPAALIMTMTRSLLRIAARHEVSPSRVVEVVNRFLTPDMNPGMFVTLVYFVLDPATREVQLVRAGHTTPLLYLAREDKLARVHPRGIAVGLDRKGPLFQSELKTQRLVLAPGDMLLTYTDGVIEAKDREGNDYSEQRLCEVASSKARGTADQLVTAITDDLARHRHGCDATDDVTIVILKKVVP